MFDLDGTLSDTVGGLAAAGNHMREQFGLPPIDTNQYNYLAGQGVQSLVEKCLETTDPEQVAKGSKIFRAHQDAHGLDTATTFEGIPELLTHLTEQGLTMAVLSNKAHPATVENVELFFSDWDFAAVEGAKPDKPVKPDPWQARLIAERCKVPPRHWMYVGDTAADMLTGSRMGFLTVGVLWGFRDEPELRENGADVIVSHPSEIVELLEGSFAAK